MSLSDPVWQGRFSTELAIYKVWSRIWNRGVPRKHSASYQRADLNYNSVPLTKSCCLPIVLLRLDTCALEPELVNCVIITCSLSLSSCSSTATLVCSWLSVLLCSCRSESSEPFSRRSLWSSSLAYLHSWWWKNKLLNNKYHPGLEKSTVRLSGTSRFSCQASHFSFLLAQLAKLARAQASHPPTKS